MSAQAARAHAGHGAGADDNPRPQSHPPSPPTPPGALPRAAAPLAQPCGAEWGLGPAPEGGIPRERDPASAPGTAEGRWLITCSADSARRTPQPPTGWLAWAHTWPQAAHTPPLAAEQRNLPGAPGAWACAGGRLQLPLAPWGIGPLGVQGFPGGQRLSRSLDSWLWAVPPCHAASSQAGSVSGASSPSMPSW